MTLYEFVVMDMNGRAAVLWEHGELITATVHPHGRSAFYTLGDFFVEVCIEDSSHKITTVAPFTVGDRYEAMVRALSMPQ